MLKLQSITGLTDADPIHTYLGVADEILSNERNWNEVHRFHKRNNEKKLTSGLFHFLRHPLQETCYPTEAKINYNHINEYREWLIRVGEPVLAKVVSGLQERKFAASDIRLVMMWITTNLTLLRERDERNYRSIDEEWEI
jgi:hypothetical protein